MTKLFYKHWRAAALLLIIFIAIFFRAWEFNSIPAGLYQDEAMNGADAVSSLKSGKFSVFYTNNNGREGMIIWLDALAIKALDAKPWVLRLFPAVFGVLAVWGLYFLAKLLFDPEIALVSSFFMAVSFWAVNFSRIGFRANLMLPFLIWSFYFLLKGFKEKTQFQKSPKSGFWQFVIAGILFGLGFYTYISYRFAPILALLTLLPAAVIKNSKKLWFGILIFIAVTFVVALPIGIYFLYHPEDFFGRASEVSVFSQKSPISAVAINTVKTLAMFNVVGDLNWRHNFSGSPELFLPVGLLFLLGIYLSVKRFSFSEKFLLSWFFVFLLPNFLTTEGNPHALRALGAMPSAMIFAGLGFVWLYKKFSEPLKQFARIRKEIFFLFISFLMFTAGFEFNKYFNKWSYNPGVLNAFSHNQAELANYLNSLPEKTEKYVIWDENDRATGNSLPVSAQTVYFLAKGKINYIKSDEFNRIKPGENGTVVAPIYFNLDLFHKLQKKYPKSIIKIIGLNLGVLVVP